ncbi:MAG: nucleotidyl transferase AbiEii/AbiGii toxin family protein [Patescibacteria group bacterium]
MIDLSSNITAISKSEKIDELRVVRDYFIGIIASVINEVHTSMEAGEIKKPVIIGGISIRKGHIPNFPRYTPDIDFEADSRFYKKNGLTPLRNYELILKEAANGVREKIVSVYGSDYGFEPKISRLREPTDLSGERLGSVKGSITIPKFINWEDVTIKTEVSTAKKTTFLNPIDLPVYHNFVDQGELKLGPITVPQLSNNLANKVYSSLNRLGSPDEQSRISRLKDIFDVWFIEPILGISGSELTRLFKLRLLEESPSDKNQTLWAKTKILANKNEFFEKIFRIITSNIKSMANSSDTEKIKRMTKGITESYKFPAADELVASFTKTIGKLEA